MEPDETPNPQRAIADRRAQLARYRTAYAECYGQTLSIDDLETDDVVLQRLLQGAS